MKYLIASDLHGFYKEYATLFRVAEAEKPDELLLLGDLLNHGMQNDRALNAVQQSIVELLNGSAVPVRAVLGNCDSQADARLYRFPVSSGYLCLNADGHTVYAFHGDPYSFAFLPALSPGDILLQGHTHCPCRENRNGVLYLNPGSFSLPKFGSEKGYMTLENGLFLWKKQDGTVFDELKLP